ncbi:DNA-binding protein, partial [Methanosalsum natronophilum]
RDLWVMDTAENTLDRIEVLDETQPNIVKANEHYNTDKKYYVELVLKALESLEEEVIR